MNKNSKIKRKDSVPWKEIKGEGLILDLENGDYHKLDKVGLFVWKLLDGKHNVKTIARRITSKYDANLQAVLTDLFGFLLELKKAKFAEVLN